LNFHNPAAAALIPFANLAAQYNALLLLQPVCVYIYSIYYLKLMVSFGFSYLLLLWTLFWIFPIYLIFLLLLPMLLLPM
jgi:hypothetical protein